MVGRDRGTKGISAVGRQTETHTHTHTHRTAVSSFLTFLFCICQWSRFKPMHKVDMF